VRFMDLGTNAYFRVVTDRVLLPRRRVFTAWYELNLNKEIIQLNCLLRFNPAGRFFVSVGI
jgi:hypothetical protein